MSVAAHIECEHLQLQIGHRLLIKDLSFQIMPGERWALLGLNGTGKTTLLHTLAGLRNTHAGNIRINGRALNDWPRTQLARQLGLLLQTRQDPFPGNVIEHVLIGRHPHLKAMQWESEHDYELALAALDTVGLSGFEQRDLAQLSGGEYQRMLIAMVLVQQPQCFLLDEPVNHLDWQHQHQILNRLGTQAQQQNISMLMALHDVNLAARYCSHVIMLFNDHSCLAGNVSQLLNSENLSRLYQTPIQVLKHEHGTYYSPDAQTNNESGNDLFG